MKKSIFTISLCFLLLFFFSLIESQHTYAQTDIPAGSVSGTWTKSNSPYHIEGEITIPNDSTLTIEPGVEVVFTGHYKFNLQGRLLAIGTTMDTITFTAQDTVTGWFGIELEDIASSNDSTIFEYCIFQYGKSFYGNGGAINTNLDKLRISHCLFRNNMSFSPHPFEGIGGAIFIEGNPIIEYCEFSWNESIISGAALSIFDPSSEAIIRNNHFHHNSGAGTIDIMSSSSPTFINNLIEHNHSPDGILRFYIYGGNAKIINNTIVNNTGDEVGGAILVRDGNPIFINNIIYGNEPSQVYFDLPSSVSFYNNLIEGGREGFTGAAFTGAYENCIDVDPQFVSSNDFHLQNTSPCIGAGIDSIEIDGAWYYCPPTDFEGKQRPNPAGSMPDIGAYENVRQNPTDTPEWITYNTTNSGLPENSVCTIAIDESGNKWIGTAKPFFPGFEIGGGLSIFDGANWIVYNSSNSGLPDNIVLSIAIDLNGNKWIGTQDSGLAKFDNTNWTVFNTSNSGLPAGWLSSISIDGNGNKWIGTWEGLAKFDDTNWTAYNTLNSGLPGNVVNCITIDYFGNKWIGTGDGLAKFNDNDWTVFNTANSDLPSNWISSIAIGANGDKWIGTGDGLAKFDDNEWTVFNTANSDLPDNIVLSIAIDGDAPWGQWIGTCNGLATITPTNWIVYNTSNSGLPSNYISSIAIDGSGNKWFGTGDGGLAVYKEGGVVSAEENPKSEIIPNECLLSQNFPNPFNPITTIKYSVPKLSFVTIKIYDVLGSEVATLINEENPVGTYELTWYAEGLPSGVYFYQLRAGNYVETKKMILLR
jgi:ligand-binding sensor domain-containing protein